MSWNDWIWGHNGRRKYFNTRWSTKHGKHFPNTTRAHRARAVNFPTRAVPSEAVTWNSNTCNCSGSKASIFQHQLWPLTGSKIFQHQLCPEDIQYYFPTPVLPVVKREQFPNTSCDLLFYIICFFTLTHVAPILDLSTPFSEFSLDIYMVLFP